MTSPRESTELTRAAILSVLWERGDQIGKLSFSDLSLKKEMLHFYEGAIDWLSAEGLIRVTKSGQAIDGELFISKASLTAKGATLLSQIEPSLGRSFGQALSEAVKDAVKDEAKAGVKAAGHKVVLAIWTTFQTWMATQ